VPLSHQKVPSYEVPKRHLKTWVPLSHQKVPSYEVPKRHLKTWVPHGTIRGVVFLDKDLAPEMVPDDTFYSNSVVCFEHYFYRLCVRIFSP